MNLSLRKIGDAGEKIAQKYLIGKGYAIIELNYRKKCGEIDIIGEKNKESLVFFEVKTRSSSLGKYGAPEEAVNYYKQKKMIKTALFYLYENNYDISAISWQFDILTVIINLKEKKAFVKHIANAFWK